MPFVYKLTNKINETVYIGKANDITKRMQGHCYYAKVGRKKCGSSFLVVDAAIAKYGFNNFTVETLYETATEDEAYQLEEIEILANKVNGIRSYNIGDGGKTNSGWHHTDATKKMISESHSYEERLASLMKNPVILTMTRSKESIEKGVKSNTGKIRTLSMRLKNSFNKRGEKNPRAKLNENNVHEIKNLISKGLSNIDIAKLYKVGRAAINNIRLGKTWKHVI